MILVIIAIGTILFLKVTIFIHRLFFMESTQSKARKLTPTELANLRDYSRELSFGQVGKRRSGSTPRVRQGQARVN